ncbi:T9SS type A sorting domain-containing protein [Hymenobacter busanensis]|uniref:T9SS type A sorting domain-containing protein n=1 Tax=Hymenobacter busanensis TaxID=2607656 RepID=A0A7L4ZZC3_9BACT|nr:T9SS type A sorting domain-containing protein [Hymenobacter busanensis]KAA9333032.1 T9SS type A sorting domain-containing protein [Hymenobacter busanensis]QHJ08293.1 T9SS type A sorting domain-containing protein [Hymenobacter busanensis]
MKKPYLVLAALALSHIATAQLSGTKTIDPGGTGPNNYPTVSAAVTALNAGGVGAGGVTFRVKAGTTFTEAIPAITASGTAANGIRFTRGGAGANPVLQTVGTGAADAVLTLDGADYVRLDSLTLRENPANTGVAQTEYGVWLKGGATNNLVQACAIVLDRANTNKTYGVHLLDGGNNANRFLSNAISNCTGAYYFAATSAANDLDNEIGNLAGGSSPLTLLGLPTTGGPPTTTIVYAVYLTFQQRAKVVGQDISDVQGPGSVYGIYSSGAPNSVEMIDNRLSNFLSRATGSGIVEALYVNSGTTHTLLRNRVHDIRATGSTAFAVGIDINGGATNYIINNFVSGVQAPASTAGTAVRALSLRGGTTNNVFHNTVLVEYAATVASNKSGAFYMSGANTPGYLANNVFVNRVTGLTPGGGGVGAAFFKATATVTTLAGSNNNLYYSASPSAEHPIFYGVATTPAVAVTLADYKQLAAPAGVDQSAVTENPTFVSAATGDLHISPTVPTQIESGGVNLIGGTAVPTDIDGQTRNANAPDLGADEGSFQGVDASGPSIAYAPLSNTSAFTSRTLSAVTITDPSGVNVAAGTKPRLYYKKNSDANAFNVPNDATGNGWKWTEATGTASPFSFTLDVSKLRAAPVAGDSIQYFVTAQDLVTPPNVSASPGTGFAATSVAAITSAPRRPNSYRVLGFISGIKTVGVSAAADYPTLTAAVADLNRSQLNGSVTLRLIDASYPSETYPITLNANPGTRPTPTATPNAVRIEPAVATRVTTLEGNATTPLLIVNASYVDVSGVGGSGYGLLLRNNGTGAASGVAFATGRNVAFRRVEMQAGSTTTGYGVAFDGVVAGLVQNCKFSRANVAVQLQNNCDSVRVFSNEMGAIAPATDPLGSAGVVVLSSQHFDVVGNIISGVTRAVSPSISGIQVGGTARDGAVRGNAIAYILHSATTAATAYGAVGIRLGTSDTNSGILVESNMISNVRSFGDDGLSFTPHGIVAASGGGYSIAHNSVYLTGTVGGGATPVSAALLLNAGVTTVGAVNNILVNNIDVTPTGGKAYSLLVAGAATQLSASNANDYLATGARGVLASINNVDLPTLAAVRTATSADQRSVSVLPVFVAPTNGDLHLTAANNCSLEGKGLPLPGPRLDIDGDARSVTTPDIGADEFVGVNCTVATTSAKATWRTDVYPNPTAGALTLSISGATGPLTLEVLDVLGRPVHRVELKAGTSSYPLDLHGHAAGLYLLRLSNGQVVSSHRVVLR